jgi:hypothetical protein
MNQRFTQVTYFDLSEFSLAFASWEHNLGLFNELQTHTKSHRRFAKNKTVTG